MDKPKLDSKKIVYDMKNKKGIKFTIIDEKNAIEYLKNKNNYYRLASYRKNYDKHIEGANEGKYINLEFAYLAELSTIDMHLRFLITKMCLDIEHSLKVRFLSDIENDENEDGYTIVKGFIGKNEWIIKNIFHKRNSVYVGDIINKFFIFKTHEENHKMVLDECNVSCPIWAFMEIITFGELIKFYQYYYENAFGNILNSVKSLRIACAHNNCVIHNLRKSGTKPGRLISSFVSEITDISKDERKNKLSIRPLYEITCLLYVYDDCTTETVKSYRYKELNRLVNSRMLLRKDYFSGENTEQQIICATYKYIKKIVDFLS